VLDGGGQVHFDTNHTGKYCTLNCSPYKHPKLKTANMSVCEQRFKWLGRFSPAFRYANSVRFNFVVAADPDRQ
jgi:hypothetical protein